MLSASRRLRWFTRLGNSRISADFTLAPSCRRRWAPGQPRPSAAAYITARGAGCKQLRMPQMINVDCLQNPFVAPRPQAYLWQQLVLDQPLGRRRYVLGHGPAIFLVAHNGASLNLAPH